MVHLQTEHRLLPIIPVAREMEETMSTKKKPKTLQNPRCKPKNDFSVYQRAYVWLFDTISYKFYLQWGF